jgi:putative NADPH-quinone reductase
MTYGADPFRAFIVGNPPKKIIKRMLRAMIKPFAPVVFLAHYDMNRSTDKTRKRFLERVKREMERF